MDINLVIIGSISISVIAFFNYRDHRKKLLGYVRGIDRLVTAYFKAHPQTPRDYFNDVLYPWPYCIKRIFTRDLNHFVQNETKFKLLEDQDNDKARGRDIACPWCECTDKKNFLFFAREPKKPRIGILVCSKCLATTPKGEMNKENIFIFDNEEYFRKFIR